MIPQQTVDQILDTARIDEVVGDFVTLRRRGASLVACCPFHNEKTPSFYVTPSKGIYKCFGCGKAGSAVGFVMEMEHVSYVEALRYLARKYHIEIEESQESAEEIVARQKRESLLLAMEFAQKFFVDQLQTPEGRTLALSYYHKRGLEDETIRREGLGWAPSSRTALRDAATAAGYKVEYLLDAGLCVRKDDGSVVDKFYARVTFPILSVSGRVIAFSCRTLRTDDNIPKYINSSDTDLYKKSNNLFGIYLAKSDISRQDKCYLVEGNVDVVSMHQLGIPNLIASCGTALTVEQVRLIKKFTSNVTVMYDGDSAGIHASLKAIDLILREDMNVRVVLLPDGDDPDSYSRKHSLGEVQEFLSSAEKDWVDFKCDILLGQAQGDPLRKANLINDIADTIAMIPDAVKRSVYVETVAGRFGIDTGILFQRITTTRQKMLADEQASIARERRREDSMRRYSLSAVAPQTSPDVETVPVELTLESLEVDRTVAPFERDLLYFLLTHGTDTLDFESDSEYYSGSEQDKATVAEFIASSIEGDEGGGLINPAFQKVYQAYIDAYDAGLDQQAIMRQLLNSEDREVSFVSAQLSVEKYQLTVKNFEASMTTTSSWLVNFVPRTILMYMQSKIDRRLSQITRELAGASSQEQELSLLQESVALQSRKQVIIGKLKRQ